MKRKAIITAVSDNMFYDFILLYDSLQINHAGIEIIVAALELNDENKGYINDLNVTVIEISSESISFFKSFSNICWRQWFKPYFCQIINSDIDLALWIDADAVVINNLDPLFDKTVESFWVINDYFDPVYCLNDARIYNCLDISLKVGTDKLVLNSGVIGWSPKRDAHVIAKWYEVVKIIISDIEYTKMVRLFDQGALLIAVHWLGITDCVLTNKSWNSNPAHRKKYDVNDYRSNMNIRRHIYDDIKTDNFNATIVHYAGLPKISHLVEENSVVVSSILKRRNIKCRRYYITGFSNADCILVRDKFIESVGDDSQYNLVINPTNHAQISKYLRRTDCSLMILYGSILLDLLDYSHKPDGIMLAISDPMSIIHAVASAKQMTQEEAMHHIKDKCVAICQYSKKASIKLGIVWTDFNAHYGNHMRKAFAHDNVRLLNDEKATDRLNKLRPTALRTHAVTGEVLFWYTGLITDMGIALPSSLMSIV